jgi:hypothetical protein
MITLRKIGIATALTLVATATPNLAAGATTADITGTFVADEAGTCTDAPEGFSDYDPFVISGELEGCWYTNVDRAWDLGSPSGLYFEVGREVFIGTYRGVPGSFSTTYVFESKWDPAFADGAGSEIWGRCQHLIARGSGTGSMRGATGFISRVDDVTAGIATYRGVVRTR